MFSFLWPIIGTIVFFCDIMLLSFTENCCLIMWIATNRIVGISSYETASLFFSCILLKVFVELQGYM